MKEKDGGYINLYWEGRDYPEYIRGHVAKEDAIKILSREGIDLGENPSFAHRYARWSWASGPVKASGCDFELRVYSERQRGCFKVTEVEAERLDSLRDRHHKNLI